MKGWVGFIAQAYWRWRFSKKATLLGDVCFGRHSRIVTSCGSTKKNIVIESGAKVYGTLISQDGGCINVGRGAHIGPFTTVGSVESVQIGSLAMISSHVEIMDNNNHPVNPCDRRKMNEDGVNSPLKSWKYSFSAPVKIGDNTWIGKKSIILKGVEVGANSVVATGAVVTKDIASNCIAAGNPAKIVKSGIDAESELGD